MLNKTRSLLYLIARILGDINAVVRAIQKNSITPLLSRLFNKILGRLTGRLFK